MSHLARKIAHAPDRLDTANFMAMPIKIMVGTDNVIFGEGLTLLGGSDGLSTADLGLSTADLDGLSTADLGLSRADLNGLSTADLDGLSTADLDGLSTANLK